MYADKIRFAELKQDEKEFVDLAKILNYKYGLNDNPFINGCNSDAVINGMPVNFRQMCGLQTSKRKKPENPEQITKQVLYYDGYIYNGWQKGINIMDERQVVKNIIKDFLLGKISETDAAKTLKYILPEKEQKELITILQNAKAQLTPDELLRNIAQKVAGEQGIGEGCCY